MTLWLRLSIGAALGFGVLSTSLFGCKKAAEEVIGTDVNGVVTDNRGQPVADATVRLYDLFDNTNFVEDTSLTSAEAYINRESVLASSNTERTIQTGADGRFKMNDVIPNAFLATAVKSGCSAGFAGFNEETGVLNWDTLIKPSLSGGVHFDVPGFVLACAAPPEVGPEGNSNDAPAFEPPEPTVTCDPATCAAAGGTCQSDACVMACTPSVCGASGGTCDGGACVAPACNPAACATTGGACKEDKCVLPACDPTACGATGGTCVGDVCNLPACDPTKCAAAGGSCGADGGACVVPVCNPQSCADAGGSCGADGGTCVIPSCNPTACATAGGSCDVDGGTCVIPACNPTKCAAAGGSCGADGGTCVVPTCDPIGCQDAGGSCAADGGTCAIPPCRAKETECKAARGACSADGMSCVIPPCFANEAACTAASGRCSTDGATCQLPACKSDADCAAAQVGATCTNPGDVALAKCTPPMPDDITPPVVATGWTSFRITDENDQVIADASSVNQKIASSALPEGGLVRVYGTYSGSATQAYLQVQSGASGCAHHRPRTDYVAVDLENGVVATESTDFVELVLHGGCQKVQLSTSDTLGQGERSHTIQIGEQCAMPRSPFIAILSWEAGRRRPANLDLNVWNASGELVFVGNKQSRWGRFRHHHGRGPGPEVFISDMASEGPFTIKVQFFAGKPRPVRGKVRIIRIVGDDVRDQTFSFTVNRPKDVVEIGKFAAQ